MGNHNNRQGRREGGGRGKGRGHQPMEPCRPRSGDSKHGNGTTRHVQNPNPTHNSGKKKREQCGKM